MPVKYHLTLWLPVWKTLPSPELASMTAEIKGVHTAPGDTSIFSLMAPGPFRSLGFRVV